MAMTLMIENIGNDFTVYPTTKPDTPTPQGSYYRFYQSKLRQLVTQTRYRKEQDTRLARQKQAKPSLTDQRLSEQRLHKEYMNHIRDRSKAQTQEILANKLDESRKNCESDLSNTSRSMNLSVASSNISTSMEPRPKPIARSRPTEVSPKQPSARVISASTSPLPNVNKPKIIPRKTLDQIDGNLSKSNIHSFTQVASSSSRTFNHQHARQSIVNTIMLHLNTHFPSNRLHRPTYDDIDQKFSSSLSPNVYDNFERTAA